MVPEEMALEFPVADTEEGLAEGKEVVEHINLHISIALR